MTRSTRVVGSNLSRAERLASLSQVIDVCRTRSDPEPPTSHTLPTACGTLTGEAVPSAACLAMK